MVTASNALFVLSFFVKSDPGDMFPDVCHFEKIAVETGLLYGLSERILVHTG